MATSRKVSDVVTEICTQLNDPNKVKYGTRSITVFLRAIRQILDNPKRYNIKESDYRGLLINEEVEVSNGRILFSALSNTVNKKLNITTSISDEDSALLYGLVEINEDYQEYAENGDHSYFYCPAVDINTQVGWFVTNDDTDGQIIKFYPEDTADGYKLLVSYLAELDIDTFLTTTELYIGATDGKFSNRMIDIATDLAVSKILAERKI